MNRGVIAYMREGNRCAKNTFKNFINTFKFYFLQIVIFFGALCTFTLPFVTVASVRVARLAERDEDIQIFKSFERMDNSKTFWSILGFYFFYGIFFLAGLVLLSILAGILFGAGLLIGGLNTTGIIIGGVLAFPLAIMLLAFLIIYPFMFAPALYLYDCNPKLGISGMFYNSVDAMRKTGKWTIFMTAFITGLRHLLWLVLIGGATFAMIYFYDKNIIRIASTVVLLALLVIYFFRAARIILAQQVANILLFNDICSSEKYISLDQSPEENTPKNVYGVSKRTLRAAKREQLLLGLFTNGEKLVDPEGIDQSKLPNEVEDDEVDEIEKDVLAKDTPEGVSEVDLVAEDYSINRRESARYYKEPVAMTDLSANSTTEEKVDEEVIKDEVVQDLDILLAESMVEEEVASEPVVEKTPVVEETKVVEETAAEPVVEEAPVVEKPKRGRKKAVPLTGVSELNDQAAETPVVEEPIEKSVTEDEIGDILNNILNIEE